MLHPLAQHFGMGLRRRADLEAIEGATLRIARRPDHGGKMATAGYARTMYHQPRLAWVTEPNAPIWTTRPAAPAKTRGFHGLGTADCAGGAAAAGAALACSTSLEGAPLFASLLADERFAVGSGMRSSRSGAGRTCGAGAGITWRSGCKRTSLGSAGRSSGSCTVVVAGAGTCAAEGARWLALRVPSQNPPAATARMAAAAQGTTGLPRRLTGRGCGSSGSHGNRSIPAAASTRLISASPRLQRPPSVQGRCG